MLHLFEKTFKDLIGGKLQFLFPQNNGKTLCSQKSLRKTFPERLNNFFEISKEFVDI